MATKDSKKKSTTVKADKALVLSRQSAKEVRAKYLAVIAENHELQSQIRFVLEMKERYEPITIVASEEGVREATAVLVASDWHIEELVKPSTVNGLNSFDIAEAERRAKAFFVNGLKLIQMAQTRSTVKRIVLALLGDFFSNSIHEELLEINQLQPGEAAWKAQNLIAGGIRYLLDNFDGEIVIVCTTGNHGRMTKKVHYSTEQGNSLETYMYHNLALEFRRNRRVKFTIAEGYHTYLDIYGKTLRLHHGHGIKYQGGVGGLTIPLNKAIAQWNKAKHADLDVLGNWHQFLDNGNAIVNGSLIGFNAFAIAIKASFERPQQAFFLMDSKHGKTLVAPVLL